MKTLIIGMILTAFIGNSAMASCHDKVIERMDRVEDRAEKSLHVGGGLLIAAWGPGLGVVWFTFPAGPAIYGGLLAGAAASGGVHLYHKLRRQHLVQDKLIAELMDGQTTRGYGEYFLKNGKKRRDKFIRLVQAENPNLTEDEIDTRFVELDNREEICTARGRYFSDRRIAREILKIR